MKYSCLISFFLFLTTSCNNSSELILSPKHVSERFLTAYFLPDFEQIVSSCQSGTVLKLDMERNAQTFSGYRSEIQDKIRKDLTAYHFRIEQVVLNRAKDSAFVSYLIMAPEAPDGIASRLTLVKDEHEWKVSKLL